MTARNNKKVGTLTGRQKIWIVLFLAVMLKMTPKISATDLILTKTFYDCLMMSENKNESQKMMLAFFMVLTLHKMLGLHLHSSTHQLGAVLVALLPVVTSLTRLWVPKTARSWTNKTGKPLRITFPPFQVVEQVKQMKQSLQNAGHILSKFYSFSESKVFNWVLKPMWQRSPHFQQKVTNKFWEKIQQSNTQVTVTFDDDPTKELVGVITNGVLKVEGNIFATCKYSKSESIFNWAVILAKMLLGRSVLSTMISYMDVEKMMNRKHILLRYLPHLMLPMLVWMNAKTVDAVLRTLHRFNRRDLLIPVHTVNQ